MQTHIACHSQRVQPSDTYRNAVLATPDSRKETVETKCTNLDTLSDFSAAAVRVPDNSMQVKMLWLQSGLVTEHTFTVQGRCWYQA